MEFTFTAGQLLAGFLALCGGIITLAGAITAVSGWIKSAKAPENKQDARITALEARVAKHDEQLGKGNRRFEDIDEGNRITQQALLALLSHGIDGNDIDSMRKAKDDLQQFLIRGKKYD